MEVIDHGDEVQLQVLAYGARLVRERFQRPQIRQAGMERPELDLLSGENEGVQDRESRLFCHPPVKFLAPGHAAHDLVLQFRGITPEKRVIGIGHFRMREREKVKVVEPAVAFNDRMNAVKELKIPFPVDHDRSLAVINVVGEHGKKDGLRLPGPRGADNLHVHLALIVLQEKRTGV